MPNRQVVRQDYVNEVVEEGLDRAQIHLRCRGKKCKHEVIINRLKSQVVAEMMINYGWGTHENRLLCPRCLFHAIGHYPVDNCAACDQPIRSDERGPFGSDCARSMEHLNLSRDLRLPYPPAWRTRSQIEIRRHAANEAWKTRRARERKSMPSESPAG